MNILIAYATRYGTTEKCANLLAEELQKDDNSIKLVDLKKNKKVDPAEYDLVIVGGSFVAFRMNAHVRKFVKRNLGKLLEQKAGIFMCGADDKWQEEIKKGFPEELLNSAIALGYFGFEMNWDKMNPMVRGMMQKAYKSDEPVSKIDKENIKKFAEELLGS